MNQNYLKGIEWQLLRGTLTFAILCFTIGLIALIFSFEHKLSNEELTENQQLQLLQTNNKVSKANRDVETYKQYLPMMSDYIESGYIGDENRVLWIDILREVTTKLKFPNLQYAISEQTEYSHKGSTLLTGSYSILKSEMQISMNVFHEGDLFVLLETLEKHAEGLFYIDQCSMLRVRDTDNTSTEDANLSVQCVLVWISVKYPELGQKEKVGLNNETQM